MAGGRPEGAALLAQPAVGAFLAVVRESGYPAATTERIAARAGITAAEFERRLGGKAEATLRIFEAMVEDFVGRVGRAFAAGGPWPASLRAAAYETARWMLERPDAAWFGFVGILEAGDMALARREEVFRWGASLIDEGRAVAPDPAAVPRAAALTAIGAIAAEMRRRLAEPAGAGVVDAVPRLMYASVRPYLGEAAARRELRLVPPPDLARRAP
jgi:AcrR family transcriptional regulator